MTDHLTRDDLPNVSWEDWPDCATDDADWPTWSDDWQPPRRPWRNPYTFPDAEELRERDRTHERIGYDPRTGHHDRRWKRVGTGGWTLKRRPKAPKQPELLSTPACTRTRHWFISAELDVSDLSMGDLRHVTLPDDTKCDCGRYRWDQVDHTDMDVDLGPIREVAR